MGETSTGRKNSYRLVVADDHDPFRESLRDMLSDEPSILVEGEAANGREAVEIARQTKPDLALMDVRMPVMDGIEATREIKRLLPHTEVLVLTAYADPDHLFEALKAGAAGYVLKDVPEDDLLSSVRDALSGGSPLDSDLAAGLLRHLARENGNGTGPPPKPGSPRHDLTPRELEVLERLVRGETNRQISCTLFMSVSTVKLHVQRIIAKLGVSDRTRAAVRATELGLVSGSEG